MKYLNTFTRLFESNNQIKFIFINCFLENLMFRHFYAEYFVISSTVILIYLKTIKNSIFIN
jgi:hypothetical protein